MTDVKSADDVAAVRAKLESAAWDICSGNPAVFRDPGYTWEWINPTQLRIWGKDGEPIMTFTIEKTQ